MKGARRVVFVPDDYRLACDLGWLRGVVVDLDTGKRVVVGDDARAISMEYNPRPPWPWVEGTILPLGDP